MSNYGPCAASEPLGRILGLAIAGILSFLFHASRVEAENCWMVGCGGRVGYVFMPDDLYPLAGGIHYQMYRRECTPPPNGNPFGDNNFPDINSVQAIVIDNTSLLEEGDIISHLGSFPPVSIVRDDDSGQCQAVRKLPRDVGGSAMMAGARVKVLGYRTFVSQRSETGSAGTVTRHEQILFALVLVQTDLK